MTARAAAFFPAIAALSLSAALAAAYDPIVSAYVPDRVWALLALDGFPVRAPVLLIVLCAAAMIPFAAVSRRPAKAGIIALLAASQMNGIRAGPIDAFDLVLTAVLAASLAGLLRGRPEKITLSPVTFFAGALVLIALPHVVFEPPVRYLVGMSGLVRAALAALAVTNLIRTAEMLSFAVRALTAVAVVSALIGTAQFLLGYLAGIHFTLLDPPQSAWKPTPLGFVMRASGLCITAQHLSGFLALAFPFALWRATETWRMTDWGKVMIMLAGVLATFNLGAAVVCGIIAAAFPFMRWPRAAPHLILAAAAAAAWGWRLGALDWALALVRQGAADKSAEQRLTLMSIGLEKAQRNPWIGTGPQDFADFSGNFWHRPVHNAYLQAMTELGAPGLLVLAALLLTLFAMLMHARQSAAAENKAVISCFMIMLVTLAMLMMSEPMLDHSNTWLFAGLIGAAACAHAVNRPAARAGPPEGPQAQTGRRAEPAPAG
jgi:O-Antigen ligase